VVTGFAARLLGYGSAAAGATAFLLAQIGEFSFVLERVGRAAGLYPAGVEGMGEQTFIAAAVVLMAITPLLARVGRALEERRKARATEVVAKNAEAEVERITLENHVIVAGYGPAARYLTRVLRDSGVPFVILTLSPTGATEAQGEGLQVILGDYSRRFLLEVAAVDAAKMLVVPDDAPDMARRVIAIARGVNPTLQIVVRTRSESDVDALIAEGADQVLVDELEIGVQLFMRVLEEYRVDPGEIEDHVSTVRAGGYAALRHAVRDAPLVICDALDEECFDTRTFTVRRESEAMPVTIGQLGLRAVSVQRGAETIVPVGDDFVLAPGDRLTARGSAQAFAEAARLLRGEVRTIQLTEKQRASCAHAGSVPSEVSSSAVACEECVKLGDPWVHLRICMSCGRVRCCDSSKNRHATKHYQESGHPIMRSYQPGEEWAWCYVDELTL
jgi:CPA2 family monovalent cation:H+ antiporter-2